MDPEILRTSTLKIVGSPPPAMFMLSGPTAPPPPPSVQLRPSGRPTIVVGGQRTVPYAGGRPSQPTRASFGANPFVGSPYQVGRPPVGYSAHPPTRGFRTTQGWYL